MFTMLTWPLSRSDSVAPSFSASTVEAVADAGRDGTPGVGESRSNKMHDPVRRIGGFPFMT